MKNSWKEYGGCLYAIFVFLVIPLILIFAFEQCDGEEEKKEEKKETATVVPNPEETSQTEEEPYDTVYALYDIGEDDALVGHWYHTKQCQVDASYFSIEDMSIIAAEDCGLKPCPYCKPDENLKYNKKITAP